MDRMRISISRLGIIKHIFPFLCALLVAFPLYSAEKTGKKTLVYLVHSDRLYFDNARFPDAQILTGHVCFRHDAAMMYCDSAYFYSSTNSLHAFSHVRFQQGDTLSGFGDVLYYDGNLKRARFRKRVKLVHRNTILLTDTLDYDRTRNLAYYYNKGRIYTPEDTLVSYSGQYYPPTYQAVFKQDVQLHNNRMNLQTDTLWYNTHTRIAQLKDSTIIHADTTVTIYSRNGWYNMQTEKAMLLDRSLIVHKDGRTMTADTIFYDKKGETGRMLGNINMTDSAQKLTIYGQYARMYKENKQGFVTDSALLVVWADENDYKYVHADTFYSQSIADTINDSIREYPLLRAFFTVRMYAQNQQAICDSLVYNGKDSTIILYHGPVCWSDSNQISGDLITVYLKDSLVHTQGNALIVQQYKEKQFNQLGSKEIYTYMINGQIDHADARGNALTIFYPDDDGEAVGVNKTESSNIHMYYQDQKIHHFTFTTKTDGALYPLDQISAKDQFLSNFFWADNERPKRPLDVFANPNLTPRKQSELQSASATQRDAVTTSKNNMKDKKIKRTKNKTR